MLREFMLIPAAVIWTGCLGPDCENEIIKELVSPDGINKVVIFSRNCGATTGYSCQASILPAGDLLPGDRGNAFIFDTPGAEVSWLDSKTLSVLVRDSARASKREVAVCGIKLVYQAALISDKNVAAP
jgi:hypothetical protein